MTAVTSGHNELLGTRPAARAWRYSAFVLRAAIGAVFVAAAITKIGHGSRFPEAVDGYELLPASLVGVVAGTLPWIELTAGLLFICSSSVRESGAVLLALLVLFSAAQTSAILRGLEIACGCLEWAGFLSSAQVSWASVARTLMIATGVVAVLVVERRHADA